MSETTTVFGNTCVIKRPRPGHKFVATSRDDSEGVGEFLFGTEIAISDDGEQFINCADPSATDPIWIEYYRVMEVPKTTLFVDIDA